MVQIIEQTDKTVPFITSENALGQYVSKLVSGVEVFDLNLWIKIDPVNRPIERNSVRSGYVSHRRTSAIDFDEHIDHRFVVLQNVKQRIVATKFCVWSDVLDV